MKRHIFTFSLVLLLQGVVMQAWSQDYQRAKDVLKGVTAQEMTLFQFPSPTSKRVIKLPKGAALLIYGKQGGFFSVRYKKVKGWGDARLILISGPVDSTTPEPVKQIESTPAPIQTSNSAASRSTENRPIRINPLLSYVMKGKSFDKQIRLGVEMSYEVSSQLGIGLLGDAVFLRGTYLDIGPMIRHRWGSGDAIIFNPAIYAGFLYYSFNHGGVKDQGFGIQTAIENDIPIMRDKSFQPAISMKLGTDLMFFYFDEVRIPIFLSVGASFKF